MSRLRVREVERVTAFGYWKYLVYNKRHRVHTLLTGTFIDYEP